MNSHASGGANWCGTTWLTGQSDLATQLRSGDYLPTTCDDRDLVPPAIAAELIARYTSPGDLVLDPDCGAGTVLVEALRAGRPTLGLTSSQRWWQLARANITAAKQAGAWCDGSVLDRPTSALAQARADGVRGRVVLVTTSLRHPERRTALPELAAALRDAVSVLHPAGYVAVVIRPSRDSAYALVDWPSAVLAAGHRVGLVEAQHAIALTGAVNGDRVHCNAGLDERRRVRNHPNGKPIALIAHRHVLVFKAPDRALPVLYRTATYTAVASAARAEEGWQTPGEMPSSGNTWANHVGAAA